jgi:hypothetical protein
MKVPSFDLNGRWIDINAVGSPEITITHDLNANTVRAEYGEVRRCKDLDGTLLAETTFDFEGALQGNRLEGNIHVCNFGKKLPKTGWVLERLELTVGADGDELKGQYFCSVDKNWMPVTFTRKPRHQIEGQVKAVAGQCQNSF